VGKAYLAGPMTGIEDFNFPAFDEAAAFLRSMDIDVINPAENFNGRQDLPWDVYLRKAIGQVAECDSIILLPGWSKSKGAQLEVHIAEALGLKVHQYTEYLEGAARSE